jgi:hypothetical protein
VGVAEPLGGALVAASACLASYLGTAALPSTSSEHSAAVVELDSVGAAGAVVEAAVVVVLEVVVGNWEEPAVHCYLGGNLGYWAGPSLVAYPSGCPSSSGAVLPCHIVPSDFGPFDSSSDSSWHSPDMDSSHPWHPWC